MIVSILSTASLYGLICLPSFHNNVKSPALAAKWPVIAEAKRVAAVDAADNGGSDAAAGAFGLDVGGHMQNPIVMSIYPRANIAAAAAMSRIM